MKPALIAAVLIAVAAIATSGYFWYENSHAEEQIDRALRSDVDTARSLALRAEHYLGVPLEDDDSSFAEHYEAMDRAHGNLNNLDSLMDTLRILDAQHVEDWRALDDGLSGGVFLLQELRNLVSEERLLTDAQLADLEDLRTLAGSLRDALSLAAVDPVEFDEEAVASARSLAEAFRPECSQC